jgi:adenine-specific DNA methylase
MILDIKCPECGRLFSIRPIKMALRIKDLEYENRLLREKVEYMADIAKLNSVFPWLAHKP